MDRNSGDSEKLRGESIDLAQSSKAFAWLDNFWYHHKWKVIIIGFFAIFLIVGIVQMANKTEADATVTVATHTIYEKNNVAALERDLESLMPRDRNEDGKKTLNLKTYKIYSENEMKEANEAETDEYGNPVIYADETFNKQQIQQFNSLIGMGECSVMILSEYMYNDLLSRREDVTLLLSAEEIFGEQMPEGALSHGIKLTETGAYEYFDSFKMIPDDAVLCVMRPFVMGSNEKVTEFAIEYVKNIVFFGK